MINHNETVYVSWESGKIQLTQEDLREGVNLSRIRNEELSENDVRSACFQADLFITFMVRLN